MKNFKANHPSSCLSWETHIILNTILYPIPPTTAYIVTAAFVQTKLVGNYPITTSGDPELSSQTAKYFYQRNSSRPCKVTHQCKEFIPTEI